MDNVDDVIAHYVSEFYNPIKAHEYYLRTRKLKGRSQSTKGFTRKQKEAWTYAKNQIGVKQKTQTTNALNDRKASIAAVHAQARQLRLALSSRLSTVNSSLGTGPDAKAERAKIATDLHAMVERYKVEYAQRVSSAKASADSSLNKEYKNIKTKVR